MSKFRSFLSNYLKAFRWPENKMLLSYNHALEKYPLLTKAVTSGIITAAGDYACQVIIEKKLDWNRVGKFTIIGTALVGPTLHYWYNFLWKTIPGQSFRPVLYRVALDQLCFSPIFIAVFVSSVLILEGKPEKIYAKLRQDWLDIVAANYAVWVPAQCINFGVVPPNFNVLFSNVVGLGWNIYMSHVSHKEPHNCLMIVEFHWILHCCTLVHMSTSLLTPLKFNISLANSSLTTPLHETYNFRILENSVIYEGFRCKANT
eukprot:gene9720-20210_t